MRRIPIFPGGELCHVPDVPAGSGNFLYGTALLWDLPPEVAHLAQLAQGESGKVPTSGRSSTRSSRRPLDTAAAPASGNVTAGEPVHRQKAMTEGRRAERCPGCCGGLNRSSPPPERTGPVSNRMTGAPDSQETRAWTSATGTNENDGDHHRQLVRQTAPRVGPAPEPVDERTPGYAVRVPDHDHPYRAENAPCPRQPVEFHDPLPGLLRGTGPAVGIVLREQDGRELAGGNVVHDPREQVPDLVCGSSRPRAPSSHGRGNRPGTCSPPSPRA